LKHKSEKDALQCESQHYPIGKIIGVYYEPGRRAPAQIQVEISLDGGNSFEKDIFYNVSDDGWGAKMTSKDG
jgi:hypothetical protein